MPTKESVKTIRRLVELTMPLYQSGIDSAGFENWRENAFTHVIRIFGEHSGFYKTFANIKYMPNQEYIDFLTGTTQSSHNSFNRADFHRDSFEKGLKEAGSMLEKMAKDLESHNSGEIGEAEVLDIHGAIKLIVPTVNDNRKKVFVIHGRNELARVALFTFLRAINLEPMEWSELISEAGEGSPYVGQVLDAAFSAAQAVIVLMTPDDEARLQTHLHQCDEPTFETKLTPQVRPNVIFEAGMAMGRNPTRTIMVQLGETRPISDIAGRHLIRMNDTTKKRQDLARRLEDADCSVNLKGTDWHTVGDFDHSMSAKLQTFLNNPEGITPQQATYSPSVTDSPAVNVLKGVGVQADLGIKLVDAGLMTRDELKASFDTYEDVFFYDPRVHGLDSTRVDLEATTAAINIVTGQIG